MEHYSTCRYRVCSNGKGQFSRHQDDARRDEGKFRARKGVFLQDQVSDDRDVHKHFNTRAGATAPRYMEAWSVEEVKAHQKIYPLDLQERELFRRSREERE